MTDHIFDILGISSREDSYTDLITYSFNNSGGFRKNLLSIFSEKDHGDWNACARVFVPIVSQSGRKKDVPDMLLVSKKANKAIIIENKIFSGEGWEQTKRYASKAFQLNLSNYLEITPEFKFYYLTLDEYSSPSSPAFNPVSYKQIINAIEINSSNSKCGLLLDELKERVSEYYDCKGPADNQHILKYLNDTVRLVDRYRRFQVFLNDLLSKYKRFNNIEFGITANQGCGYIPLCLWQKESWKGLEYGNTQDGTKCFNIHFEWQWDTRQDCENLCLYLHYETNPYFKQKELKVLKLINNNFFDQYINTRSAFVKYVKNNAGTGWDTSRYSYLKAAHCSFDKNIYYGDLKNRAYSLIDEMTVVVDDYINSLQG